MLSCPALTAEKRSLMEQHIGYRHEVAWWSNEANRDKAKSFRISDYKPTEATPVPGMMVCQRNQPHNPYAHGVATLMGMEVDAYFDLGGIRILINDDKYHDITVAVERGLLPNTKLLTLEELGFSSKGVPVDLACSTNGGSSVVWIKRWVRTNIAITTKTGLQHVLT